jgi:hypothetical protein
VPRIIVARRAPTTITEVTALLPTESHQSRM